MQKLNKSEFKTMIALLHRFASEDMDQFDNWSFNTQHGPVYIELSRKPSGPESAYDDLNRYVRNS